MLKKIIWILPLLALLGGAAAGDLLTPDPQAELPGQEDGAEAAEGEGGSEGEGEGGGEGGSEGEGEGGGEGGGEGATAWFSFPSQFFVPLVQRGEIDGMMILTLTIETSSVDLIKVSEREHRLRDALLRSLIIHANTGGFTGNYTDAPKLDKLREALLTAAVGAAGSAVQAVLVEDIGLAGN